MRNEQEICAEIVSVLQKHHVTLEEAQLLLKLRVFSYINRMVDLADVRFPADDSDPRSI